jgi:hypothetical protein
MMSTDERLLLRRRAWWGLYILDMKVFSLHVHHCSVDANLLYSTTTGQEICLMLTAQPISHFHRISGRERCLGYKPRFCMLDLIG